MKKLIITSVSFDGEINVVFSPELQLMLIDFSGADMHVVQINYFKKYCPVVYEGLEAFEKVFNSQTMSVVEADFKLTFSTFWTKYNKKINRLRCEKIWHRLSESDKVKAVSGIKSYNYHLQINTWKNKLDPETYLKERSWENEWKN